MIDHHPGTQECADWYLLHLGGVRADGIDVRPRLDVGVLEYRA